MIWWIMIGAGFANFLSRFLMFSGFRGTHLPSWVEPYLAYVPTAVMSAIVVASISSDWQSDASLFAMKLGAAILAFAIAIWFRSVLATIIVGLAAFQFLLNVF